VLILRQFLLLGGYTISTAFARCELELVIASYLQSRFGKFPKIFILAVMFLGLFLSMWISNHTAPILCTSILVPIVENIPQDSRSISMIALLLSIILLSSSIRFTKALLIGLAFACNFGGMTTPISSLQNALAVAQLQEVSLYIE
jgi:phosphate transporter